MSERPARPRKPSKLSVPLLVLPALASFALWAVHSLGGPEPRRAPYSELLEDVRAGRVLEARIKSDEVVAKLHSFNQGPGETLVVSRVPNVDERALLDAMEQQHVVVTGFPESSWWPSLLGGIVPMVVFVLLLRSNLGAGGNPAARGRPMTFGRTQAKLYDRSAERATTFEEVAGVDEAKAELVEVVQFLKQPAKYRAIGARVPKGVLLVGPPGTGKTLLARAVAGESGVPFFSLSGSEFVEMFVGVGASRVRDLFEQAKQRVPCIVFIDELDAVGKVRAGAGRFAANEEREQTLNQLLVEMDGFDAGSGLVLMAATNRPEILDRALLRAGRFDRQVLVDRPDVRGREAILRVHARQVQLAPDVDLSTVAKRTPGMVGADLANVINEAALATVRRGATVVAARDLEEAIDRMQLGLRKEGRVMTDAEKRRVAVHEAGHALVALTVKNADPVHRVTIIPRSIGALGATLQLPTHERYLMGREEIRDRLCVLLGGRSAEELLCGDDSTGAADDLERATDLAREMVCRFGMTEALGPVHWARQPATLFGSSGDLSGGFSEETACAIDREVRAILETEHDRAHAVLSGRSAALEAIAAELLARETLDGPRLEEIAREHSGAYPAASC